ncbi:hypothetical protein Fot_04522 [Forsythia ovata]|uniref:Uncharacterized protein n=1 Tax=Forsythia ovata TaxID=205694 RepID=A0ABD1XCV1_9LAMI
MGKKQRESDVRKKVDFVKFLRGLDEECSGSSKRVGSTSVDCKGPSLSPWDESSAGLKEIREEDSQLSPKSLSCSRTLGEFDMVSDGSSEKLQPMKEGNKDEQKSDKSKKRLAKQKGKAQEKLLKQSSGNVGASSSAGIDRAAATKDRLKDILAKRLFKNKYPQEHIWDELKKQERYKRNEGSAILDFLIQQ